MQQFNYSKSICCQWSEDPVVATVIHLENGTKTERGRCRYSCPTGRARAGPAHVPSAVHEHGTGASLACRAGPICQAGFVGRASPSPARHLHQVVTPSTQNDFKISNLRFKFTNRSQNRSTFHDNKFIKLSCFGCCLVKNLCR